MRTTSLIAVLALCVLGLATIAPIQAEMKLMGIGIKKATATGEIGDSVTSTLTFTSTNTTASVNLVVGSENGTFATSTDGTNNTIDQRAKFTITTNNATGYTVKLTATGSNTALTSGSNSGTGADEHTISSITATTPASDFTDTGATGQALNNKWGYIPNYYNSVLNTDNNYYPAPTSSSEATIRTTSTANSVDGVSNADEYTIGLGLRADYTNPSGTYANATFLIQYVANQIAYEISFVDGAVARKSTNLPSSIAGSTSATAIILPNTVPTKDGYDFNGWCTVEPAITYGTNTCVDINGNTGMVLNPGSEFGINQTLDYSNISLYALWTSKCNSNATTINDGTRATLSTDAICMQDINDTVINSMPVGTQYQLRDSRDWKLYFIARQADGKVWMTQNLDLDIETASANVEPLTSLNTDISTSGSGAYATGYTSATAPTSSGDTTVITWTPIRATAGTASSWSNNYNSPYSFDYGNHYVYTDQSGTATTYSSTADCETAHNDGTCAHHHTGNYYNFTAAVASNSTAGLTSGTMTNSVCPKGWRLTSTSTRDDAYLWFMGGITTSYEVAIDRYTEYKTNGYINISNAPIYMTRTGYKSGTSAPNDMATGYYRMNTLADDTYAYTYYFNANHAYNYSEYSGSIYASRGFGLSVRCIARQGNTGTTTITFDKNNESAIGTMSAQNVTANTTATLTTNGYSLADYYFNGWNTMNDGSGIAYSNAGSYRAAAGTDNQSVTLYAQWAPARTITLVADTGIEVSGDNGANWTAIGGTTAITVGQGNTILLKAKDNTEGTVFSNWTLDSGAGNFTTNAWRNSNTKTTTFIVGDADVTITAHGTTTYTTIADSAAESPLTMQSITACPDWLTTESSYQLIDRRENNNNPVEEVYYVAKLADGKCWLQDNLRLGGDTAIVLTNTDSNLRSASYTLPVSKSSSWSNSYTVGEINIDSKGTIPSTAYGNASKKIGVYYNYCAASAGTVCTSSDTTDASYDICPKGWRMPTGGGVNTIKGYGEYQALYTAYNSNQANYKAALSSPLSGYYYSSSARYQGSIGYFWSSTFAGGDRSYYLRAIPGGVYPSNNSRRRNGFSVRCVFGG